MRVAAEGGELICDIEEGAGLGALATDCGGLICSSSSFFAFIMCKKHMGLICSPSLNLVQILLQSSLLIISMFLASNLSASSGEETTSDRRPGS